MSEIFSKILKDKNGKVLNVGSKYKQPEWGADTAIVDILPETELTILSEDEPMAVIQEKVTLVSGAVYTVNYNGTEYNCTAYASEDGSVVTLGNAAADGGEDTGEPFYGGIYSDDMAAEMGFHAIIVPLDGSTTFTVSIKGEVESIHTIPPEYIPFGRIDIGEDMAASKTYAEILAAINAGVNVFAVYRDKFGTLENVKKIYQFSHIIEKDNVIVFTNTMAGEALVIAENGMASKGTFS